MVRRTKCHYPDFPFDLDPDAKAITDWNNAKLHNSRSVVYYAWRFAIRSIANVKIGAGFYQKEVSRDRHAHPIGEKIHISALQRLLPDPSDAAPAKPYKPTNLENVLEAIETTYRQAAEGVGQPDADSKPSFDLPVVDWDGREIPKHGPRAEQLLQLLARRARDAAPAVRPGAVHASAKESPPVFERSGEAPGAP